MTLVTKIAGHATKISENENYTLGGNSVPVVEARPGTVSMVAGAKTTLKPGQKPNDHPKMLHSTKFSVGIVESSERNSGVFLFRLQFWSFFSTPPFQNKCLNFVLILI